MQEKLSRGLYGAPRILGYAFQHMIKKAPPRGRQQAQKVWRSIYLRDWREYRGLSTERLAEESGLSIGTISMIENYRSAGSPNSLEKLAKALRIEIGDLLDVKPDPDRRGSVMRVWVNDEDRERFQRLVAAFLQQK